MATELVVTREVIAAAIAAKREAQRRMPVHWEKRREEISAELEVLVLEWLASDASTHPRPLP